MVKCGYPNFNNPAISKEIAGSKTLPNFTPSFRDRFTLDTGKKTIQSASDAMDSNLTTQKCLLLCRHFGYGPLPSTHNESDAFLQTHSGLRLVENCSDQGRRLLVIQRFVDHVSHIDTQAFIASFDMKILKLQNIFLPSLSSPQLCRLTTSIF